MDESARWVVLFPFFGRLFVSVFWGDGGTTLRADLWRSLWGDGDVDADLAAFPGEASAGEDEDERDTEDARGQGYLFDPTHPGGTPLPGTSR